MVLGPTMGSGLCFFFIFAHPLYNNLNSKLFSHFQSLFVPSLSTDAHTPKRTLGVTVAVPPSFHLVHMSLRMSGLVYCMLCCAGVYHQGAGAAAAAERL